MVFAVIDGHSTVNSTGHSTIASMTINGIGKTNLANVVESDDKSVFVSGLSLSIVAMELGTMLMRCVERMYVTAFLAIF